MAVSKDNIMEGSKECQVLKKGYYGGKWRQQIIAGNRLYIKTVYHGRHQRQHIMEGSKTANYGSYQRQHILEGSKDSIIWEVVKTI